MTADVDVEAVAAAGLRIAGSAEVAGISMLDASVDANLKFPVPAPSVALRSAIDQLMAGIKAQNTPMEAVFEVVIALAGVDHEARRLGAGVHSHAVVALALGHLRMAVIAELSEAGS